VIHNDLDIDNHKTLVKENMNRIQTENNELYKDKYKDEPNAKDILPLTDDTHNFSIEMETGTGKTYCYLRTIFELHKIHNLRKFVIVVPSIAIRTGVIKTFEQTKSHFAKLYP
jgi:type III restriction enzyme